MSSILQKVIEVFIKKKFCEHMDFQHIQYFSTLKFYLFPKIVLSFAVFSSQLLSLFNGLPQWVSGKEYACNAGDTGLIPGRERSPGEGNGNPLQYSCLGNHMDRGAWWAIVHGVERVRHDLATQSPPPQGPFTQYH